MMRGKQPPQSEYESSDEDVQQSSKHKKKKKKKSKIRRKSKADEREEELESIFQQLKEKHESKFSGPQLRLWAHMTCKNIWWRGWAT